MTDRLDELLTKLEDSGQSAALAVADHLRTVAANGPDYATDATMVGEALALKECAQRIIDELQ